MRIELQFLVQKNEFPLDYRRTFISFLKSCLTQCNEGVYMDKYYEPGKEKEYSFAIFFEKPKFLQNNIELGSQKVKMVFSTSDKLTGFIFYSTFLENKNKKFPLEKNNEMTLINVKQLQKQTITSTQVLFQTASPLCIRKHNTEKNLDYYYSCSSEDFKTVFLYVIKKQLENAGFPKEYIDGLNIEPVHCKTVIVKHYNCKIECTLGKFMMEGNQNVLQYLFNAGAGSRKSSGFGMLELILN